MKIRSAILLICLAIILGNTNSFAQWNILPNESILFSFKTNKGKQILLAKDTANRYIVYRYGTANKTAFEFPKEKNESSWSKFSYSFFLRGGGKQNDGLDLNYVQFTNEGFKYVVYDTYSASSGESDCGVKVIALSTQKTTDIKGLYKTRKGTLIDFRTDERIQKSEELFD